MRIIHSTLDWVRIRAADNSRGILLMAGGTLLATATLVFIRLLGRDLPTAEIIFLRYAFALLAIAPWILRVGIGNTFATSRPRLRLHGIRGAIATISTGAWYYAITVVPLAQALALNCLAAIFVTIGAVVFLGEKADARRWTAVLTGLFGAWIILRPGFQAVSTGSMIVVCSAVGYGATMLFIKVLARTDSPLTIVAYLYVFNVIYSAIPAALVWETPSLTHVVWLVVIGLLSSLGHLAITQAFKEGDATAVVPADFTRLAWAALLGYVVFSEIPDVWTIAGALVIFASTTLLAYLEARGSRARSTGSA